MDTKESVVIEEQFAGDSQRRQRLREILEQVLEVANSLEMSDEQNVLKDLKTVIESDTFKVLVLGEFNTGKSTFINALLGQEILPSYATPATAIINEIKWGDSPIACLHFHEPDKKPVTISASRDVLEEYVVIKDEPDQIRESPYSHIELFWPIELCRNRIELIDSPGLNESKVREQVTLNYLSKVDAVIFVMMANKLGPSIQEQETLELLNEFGHKELFFIINQYDLLRLERDRQAVRKRAFEQFPQYTQRPTDEAICFISSLDALCGRMEGNSALLEGSGILSLEQVLTDFLFNERSRIKSKRAAMNLQLSISHVQKVIPDKRTYLQIPLEDLRQRYDKTRTQFGQLSEDKNRIIRRIDRFRRDIQILVDSKIRDFFRDLEVDIDSWANEHKVSLKPNLNVKKQVSDMRQELGEILDEKLKESFEIWAKDVLMPFISSQAEALKDDLERLTEDFESNLRQTRLEMLGARLISDDFLNDFGPKNAFERALAAAGGFFLLGVAGAGLGATLGWRQVVNAFLPQLGVYAVSSIIGLPILPMLIVAATIQGVVNAGQVLKDQKDETVKEYKQNLQKRVSDQSREIIQQIDRHFSLLSEQLEKGLQMQIDEVKEQVETALSKQEEGQQAVDEKLAEINEMEKELSDISVHLVQFIALVDQT